MNEDTNILSTELTQYAINVASIKAAIERARYRGLAAANREILSLYFGVGRYVSENTRHGKWGQRAIATISNQLQKEMPGLRGFSETGIRRMRTFYEEWADVLLSQPAKDKIHPLPMDEFENMLNAQTGEIHPSSMDETQVDERLLLKSIRPSAMDEFDWGDFLKISFTCHSEILVNAKTLDARLFYIHHAAANAWTVATLKNNCRAGLYEHRGTMPNNFTKTIPDSHYAVKATMAFKDEYLLDMLNVENIGEREEDWNERVIEQQIVRNIKDFILRFGKDFTFVGSQYRLIVGEEEMFADLVFFNRELNASVIVELKRGKFRANYLGQLSGYLSAYDILKRKPHENPSIGIILCHDASRKFVEFLVRDYDKPMGVATYRTAEDMPERLRNALPDLEEMKKLLETDKE